MIEWGIVHSQAIFLKEKNRFCILKLYLCIKMGVLLKFAMSMKAHWLYFHREIYIISQQYVGIVTDISK